MPREPDSHEDGSPKAIPAGLDPRVLQANERTLLAWIRTGIALMAFGFVIARFATVASLFARGAAGGDGSFAWLGLALVALGTVSIAAAGIRFARVRRAVVEGTPLVQGPYIELGLSFLLTVFGVALALLLQASSRAG